MTLTLELYVLRRLLAGLVFACGGMALVAVPCVLVHAVAKVAGVGMGAVLGYMPILMLELAPYLLPIGFLLALVSTYGRLASDNEWTAILMAGVHPLKMARPAALVALAASLSLYFLAANVSPSLNYQKRSYGKSSAMQLLRSLNPGRTELRFGEFYLSARERDAADRNVFRQVFLHLPKGAGQPAQTVYAQAVKIAVEGSTLLIDLTAPRWADERYDMRVGHVSLRSDLDELFGTRRKDHQHWKYQKSGELARRVARSDRILAEQGEAALAALPESEGVVPPEDLRAARYELRAREALSLICPMFLLLGIPTGLALRKGSQLGALAAAIGYALLYYLLSMRLGKALAAADAVPAWLAAWGPTLLGAAVGAVLMARVLRR